MAHESEGFELRGIKLQEVHKDVERYFSQPEKLQIRFDGERITEDGSEIITYTVDTLTVIRGFEARFEFKPLSKLRPKRKLDPRSPRSILEHERADKLRRKLRIVRQAYRILGELWLPLTEGDFDAMSNPFATADLKRIPTIPLFWNHKQREVSEEHQTPAKRTRMKGYHIHE